MPIEGGPAAGDRPPLLVELRRDGAVAHLTLNRPDALNALSGALVAALRDALARLRDGGSVRALVVTGAGGRAFCAGADLKERRTMTLDDTRAYLDALNDACDQLAAFPAPVVAALNGLAFGGGLELALACDLRIAAEGIEVGLLEAAVGIIPGAGGTYRLPRLVGVAAAKELILTARRIPAARAHEIGLVNDVVPAAALLVKVDGWLDQILACAPVALAQAKRAIDGAADGPRARVFERSCYEVALGSDDRNEGLRAFGEKRRPVFRGR